MKKRCRRTIFFLSFPEVQSVSRILGKDRKEGRTRNNLILRSVSACSLAVNVVLAVAGG
jgi:hypothetical protein